MLEAKELAAETGYVLERDHAFQVRARRDRMFGRWVARLLGLTAERADRYGRKLMLANIETADDEAALTRVQNDLAQSGVKGICASEERLRRKLDLLQAVAEADLRG